MDDDNRVSIFSKPCKINLSLCFVVKFQLDIKLNEIWKACRKIQDTIFRYGYDISKDFCEHDPQGKGLISGG